MDAVTGGGRQLRLDIVGASPDTRRGATMATTATEWLPMFMGSGTTIVVGDPGEAWLHVVIVNPVDDDAAQTQRMQVCYELAAYLNGGPRPAWMDDLDYTGGDRMTGADGLVIEACGPGFDGCPPDEAAKTARAWLMFQLHRPG